MKIDATIVGAGPAGSWAAYQLARRGARVTLVDGSHPREKPCGGGVTGRALALTATPLGRSAFPACCIRTARFLNSSAAGSARTRLKDEEPAVVRLDASGARSRSDLIVASRADFDGALLAAAREAGAQLVKARAIDVVRDDDGVRVDTAGGSLRSRVVIGADGANSLVRRRLARPFTRAQLSIATGYFAHGVTSDEIVIEFVSDPPGYIWSFPRPTHLAIGICARADAGVTAAALRSRTKCWIEETRIAEGARLEPYSWPIPSLSASDFGELATSAPGWFLVGDAAGLVDPITREGIYFALLSGEWAADALASDDRLAHVRYRERVHDEIAADLACAARYQTGFFRPRFMGLMIDALKQSARVRGVMADLVAGRQRYATLKWRLAATLEVGLAWRLMRSTWSA